MIRHAVAVAVVAACLSPCGLYAQSTEFTVNAASASVHKSPSTGSPVIGKATRGTVLPVTRDLGSWVRIPWPQAEDGVGYLHVSTGWRAQISPRGANQAAAPAAVVAERPAPQPVAAPPASIQTVRPGIVEAPEPAGTMSPAAHHVGIGGRMGGSTLGFGASARTAVRGPVGVQVEVSRYALSSASADQRMTSIQFAPSVLYSLPDALTDYVWIRPYVGAGVTIYRSTLSSTVPVGVSVTDTRLGRQAFGGTELIFASVPRFTLSADYGYRWPQTPFEGFELGGRGLAVAGHWYIK
jgi:hypothetical protein